MSIKFVNINYISAIIQIITKLNFNYLIFKFLTFLIIKILIYLNSIKYKFLIF
jgi:hypothetical protein